MKPRTALVRRYLFAFTGWLILFAALYLVLFPFYAKAVLWLSAKLLGAFTTTEVRLFAVPGKGIALSYAGGLNPMGFRFDLFSIALNLMFAPALVMTTLRISLRAAGLAALSIGIMAGLHALHVAIIVLHFLTQGTNPLIPENFPAGFAMAIHWSYTFVDKMGYTLFPFIAWFAVCAADVLHFLGRRAGPLEKPVEQS